MVLVETIIMRMIVVVCIMTVEEVVNTSAADGTVMTRMMIGVTGGVTMIGRIDAIAPPRDADIIVARMMRRAVFGRRRVDKDIHNNNNYYNNNNNNSNRTAAMIETSKRKVLVGDLLIIAIEII